MKYLCHVPTEQYGFISVEVEGEASNAVVAYQELQREWKDKKDFLKILLEYLTTGGIVNGGNYVFSDKEKNVLKEVKKLLKTNK